MLMIFKEQILILLTNGAQFTGVHCKVSVCIAWKIKIWQQGRTFKPNHYLVFPGKFSQFEASTFFTLVFPTPGTVCICNQNWSHDTKFTKTHTHQSHLETIKIPLQLLLQMMLRFNYLLLLFLAFFGRTLDGNGWVNNANVQQQQFWARLKW